MSNKIFTGVVVVLAVIILALTGLLIVNRQPVAEKPIGALPGPDIYFPYLAVNGVSTFYHSAEFNNASTTLCSFKSPAATSTLVFGSTKIRTGTTTAIALEIGKSTLYDATTTRISYVTLGSLAQVTLGAFVASTTGSYGSLGQQHTADETDLIFAPNTYLNVKYGATKGSLNVLKGTCKAEFIEN